MATNNNMTGIGAVNAIGFKRRKVSGGSYISPDLLDSLVGVWEVRGKSNKDNDRNIINNKIKDRGGDFELLNFTYKENSGYGKYETDFTTWNVSNKITSVNSESFSFTTKADWILLHCPIDISKDTPSFKVRIKINKGKGNIYYNYINKEGKFTTVVIQTEEYETPISYNTLYTGDSTNIGFTSSVKSEEEFSGTITQIPSFQGALVTDGVDDMIVSQRSINEMLDESDEVTVVSMIHQIASGQAMTRTNFISNFGKTNNKWIDNQVSSIGKTGIYGYSYKGTNLTTINNILGDKNDYTSNTNIEGSHRNGFSVSGYFINSGLIYHPSSVAWYWTFIAKKALTTDEINQVIAYYNLDKYVKPDVYYDVKKQGLSNNTLDEDWYLKDFSGNGRDMQLSNFGKKLGSGVGEYKEDFTNWQQTYAGTAIISHDKLRINKASDINNGFFIAWKSSAEIKAFRAKITGIPKGQSIRYIYVKDKFRESVTIDTDGEYDFPHSLVYASGVGFTVNSDFPKESYIGVTIEQIPNYEGALVFDGVEDYGQFIGDLGLKDYTVTVDRAYVNTLNRQVPIVSSIKAITSTQFLIEHLSALDWFAFSFSTNNNLGSDKVKVDRNMIYQSTYMYNGNPITKGAWGGNSTGLTIGRFGTNTQYANIALWSLLLFPYTLSEFLLERQLKRYKLGTLYPDMVEFRPIINSNHEYTNIIFRNTTNGDDLEIGEYYDLQSISIFIQPINIDEVSAVKVNGVKAEFHSYDSNSKYYRYDVIVTKSPQKINIAIDEYIRYEDIVQPYPTIFRLTDVDNNKEYTYGDKLKIGNKVKIASVKNLLPELYSPVGTGIYNGDTVFSGNVITVEKTMTFGWSKPFIYLKANEPNCILAPQILRIPNSSYKILGYIPDLTGKGNHGVINNSAYAGMSGANGYAVDWSTWTKNNEINITDSKITFPEGFNKTIWVCYMHTDVPSYKVKISGIPDGGIIKYGEVELHNGINELIGREGYTNAFGFRTDTNSDWSNLVIQQIGKYEGSFCLDGVDDFITIPTLSHSAKQVLMKVNTQNMNGVLYDQRNAPTSPWHFAVYNTTEADSVAYNARNTNGKTYIDGVLNTNITCQQLLNITHNLTITNNGANVSNSRSPVIGSGYSTTANFSKIALYTLMIFDDISSEDEIKELNDIVGIEGGYVESPDYYWDAYGKSNTQADDIDNGIKGIINSRHNLFDKSITGLEAIKQTNVDGSTGRVHDRALVNKNFAFNEESGYGGWLGIKPALNNFNYGGNSTINSWSRGGTFVKGLNRRSGPGCGYALAYYFNSANKILKFKVKIAGLTDADELYICQYNTDPEIKQQLVNGINEVILDTSTSINPNYSYVSFRYPPLTNDVDFEFLYEYPNGLVSDGVDDHLINTVIPAFTDFTVIAKRKFLSTELKLNESFCMKGDKDYAGVGNAFVMEYFNANDLTSKQTHILSFGENNTISREESDISWCTSTSYNNITINRGEREDTVGLSIGIYSNVYWKGVFYKMMLYSKTIDMLSINMLKNLFAQDILIDVNHPIFKKYEDNE